METNKTISEDFLDHLTGWTRSFNLIPTNFSNKENDIASGYIHSMFSIEKKIESLTGTVTDIIIDINIGHELLEYIIKYEQKVYTLNKLLIHTIVENLIHFIRINNILVKEINFIVRLNTEQINHTNKSTTISAFDINNNAKIVKRSISLIVENIRPYYIAIRFSTTKHTFESDILCGIFIQGLDDGINMIDNNHVKLMLLSFENPNDYNYYTGRLGLTKIQKIVYDYINITRPSNHINKIAMDLNNIEYMPYEIYHIFNIINMFNYKYTTFGNFFLNVDSNIKPIIQSMQSNLIAHGLNTSIMPDQDNIIFDQVVLDFSDAIMNKDNINFFINAIDNVKNLRYLFLPMIDIDEKSNIFYIYKIYTLLMMLIGKSIMSPLSVRELKERYDDTISKYMNVQNKFDASTSIYIYDKIERMTSMNDITFQKYVTPDVDRLVWTVSRNTRDDDIINMITYVNNIIEEHINNSLFLSQLYGSTAFVDYIINSRLNIRHIFRVLESNYNYFKDKKIYINEPRAVRLNRAPYDPIVFFGDNVQLYDFEITKT